MMSMTPFHRKMLEKSAPDLLNDLDADDIVPFLLADETITRDDADKINTKVTRREKVSQLLDILPRRGDGAYISLQSSLTKMEGSSHLYESMKKLEESYEDIRDHDPHDNDDQVPMSQECSTDSISVFNDVPMQDVESMDKKHLVGLVHAGYPTRGRQPQRPAKLLKDPDLLELAEGLGEHWETLALKLGLSRSLIYQCKENNKFNLQSQIFDMLYKWKCKSGKGATVAVLLDACKKINDLGEDVYEFLYDLR